MNRKDLDDGKGATGDGEQHGTRGGDPPDPRPFRLRPARRGGRRPTPRPLPVPARPFGLRGPGRPPRPDGPGHLPDLVRDPHDVDDAFQATFLALVRKGATVRGAGALGGWLHRVAHRVAVRANVDAARRRDRERLAGLARAEAPSSNHRDESIAAVHDELARLPDRFRLPVVLCHLEGKTHAQAAIELGWGEATVRRRLSDARVRLRRRLTQRGVAPAPALLALARPPIPLPPACLETALKFALGGAPAGAVSALAASAIRSLAASQTRSLAGLAAGLVALVGLAGLGIASGLGPIDAGPKATRPATPPPKPPRPEARAGPEPDPQVVRGVVQGPGGRPVAGAAIRLWEFGVDQIEPDFDPPALARTDASGRFEVHLPPAGPNPNRRIVASAEGLGLGWSRVRAEAGDRTIRLPDDSAIEGRILDPGGRPVAGAEVGVFWLGDLERVDSFLAMIRNSRGAMSMQLDQGTSGWLGRLPGQTSYIKAGPDGRFRISGIGRDRNAELIVRGPSIAEARITVVNRPMEPVMGFGSDPHARSRVFGSTFDFQAGPSMVIEGVVRDRATGRPLAGVRVWSPRVSGKAIEAAGRAGVGTDAEGRFALLGHPESRPCRLAAIPPPGSNYLGHRVDLASIAGPGPIQAEILLSTGIPFRLRPVLAATGQPAEVSVAYYALHPNPNVEPMAGKMARSGPISRAARQADGSYIGLALPGPGAICIEDPGEVFRRTRVDPWAFFRPGQGPRPPGEPRLYGDENVLIIDDGSTMTWRLFSDELAAIVLIDPAPDSGPIEREARLTPGSSPEITVLGPDGRSLAGAKVWDLYGLDYWSDPLPGSTFRAARIDPARPRKRIVHHDGLKLAGQVIAPGDRDARLTLNPWARVAGRLVDARGNPRPGVRLKSPGRRGDDPTEAIFSGLLPTDAEGRFRLDCLVPGLRHSLAVMLDGGFAEGSTLFDDLILEPGEVRDFGDIRVEADRPAMAPKP